MKMTNTGKKFLAVVLAVLLCGLTLTTAFYHHDADVIASASETEEADLSPAQETEPAETEPAKTETVKTEPEKEEPKQSESEKTEVPEETEEAEGTEAPEDTEESEETEEAEGTEAPEDTEETEGTEVPKDSEGSEESENSEESGKEENAKPDRPKSLAQQADKLLSEGISSALDDILASLGIDRRVYSLQKRIDALPEPEEVEKMSDEEKADVASDLDKVNRIYSTLTDEQKSMLSSMDKVERLCEILAEYLPDLPFMMLLGDPAPEGTKENPWNCGPDGNESSVQAYLEGNTLYIFGSGRMKDFDPSTGMPWNSVEPQIKHIEVGSGVTSIGANAFNAHPDYTLEIKTVKLADSVTEIGENAFYWAQRGSSPLQSINTGNVRIFGADAFRGCGNVESFDLSSAEQIDTCAFQGAGGNTPGNCIIQFGSNIIDPDAIVDDAFNNGYIDAYISRDWLARYDSTEIAKIEEAFSSMLNKMKNGKFNFIVSNVVNIADDIAGGSISANKKMIPTDDTGDKRTVTLTVTPDADYVYSPGTLSVTKNESGDAVTVTQDTSDESKFTFTMPEDDVNVTCSFDPAYTVNIDDGITNGSVTSDKSFVLKSETDSDKKKVTLTVTPAAGYKLEDISVYKRNPDGSNGAVVETTKNNDRYTFTIPDSSVNVTASFVMKPISVTPAKSNYEVTYGDDVSVSATADIDGATLTYEVTNGSDYISVDPSTGKITYLKPTESATAAEKPIVKITASKEGYPSGSVSVNVETSRIPVKMTTQDLTRTIGDDIPEAADAEFTISTLVGSDTKDSMFGGSTFELDDALDGKSTLDTAGEYSIEFTPDPDGAYKDFYNVTVVPGKLTVNKKTQTVTADDPIELEYGETGVSAGDNAKAVDSLGGDTGAALTFNVSDGTDIISIDNSTGEITALDVGTAKVKITAAETDEFAPAETEITVTVSKGTPVIECNETSIEMTYGDTAPAGASVASPDAAKAITELDYSVDDDDIISVADDGTVTALKPGTATITVTTKSNDKFKPAEAKTINVTVKKAPLTVTADDKSATQGGTLPTFTCTPMGLVNGDTLPSGGFEVECPTADMTAPGEYPIKVTPVDSDAMSDLKELYDIECKDGTLTVSAKKTQTITASVPDDLVYGDTGEKVTAMTSGDGALSYSVPAGNGVVTVDTKGNLTILAPGETTLTVTAAETSEYAPASETVPVKVGKAKLTITPDDKSAEKGEAMPEFTYTAEGLVGSDKIPSDFELSCTAPDTSTIGKYAIKCGTISAPEFTKLYDITYEEGELTVAVNYKVIMGAGLVHVKGSGKDEEFASNGKYDYFEDVAIDGKIVQKKEYTSWSGSTHVKFFGDFMDSLDLGTHTLKFIFEDGDCSCEFRVIEPSTGGGGGGGTTSPTTADSGDYMLAANLMILATATAASAIVYLRRKEERA